MDAEAALFEQAVESVDADCARVFGLQRAPDRVAAVDDREDDRVEQRLVVGVERAVDNDIPRVADRVLPLGIGRERVATQRCRDRVPDLLRGQATAPGNGGDAARPVSPVGSATWLFSAWAARRSVWPIST